MKVTVTARVQRVGDWWEIDVLEVDGVYTQARQLDEVPAMASDAVSLMLDGVAVEDVEVTVVRVDGHA